MPIEPLPIERFALLAGLPDCVHAFITRVPGIDAREDKQEALRRLDVVHREARADLGLGTMSFLTADQVHGNEVCLIDELPEGDTCMRSFDGLVTNQPNVCLGIYVADCCAVYLVDPVRHCIGLVHSGRKGTECDIAGRAIDLMGTRFGSAAKDLLVQLSPCIRPPHYEIDFAAEIVRRCRERGVVHLHDSGTCTACHLQRYYSYRAEKGKTGRMLALLAMTSASAVPQSAASASAPRR